MVRTGWAWWCGLLSCFVEPGGSVLPTNRLIPTASPHPAVMPCSLFPFPFRPTPHTGSLLLAGLNQSPAPRAWDVRTGGRSAAAGGMAVCLLLSCRVALSLTLVRYCLACGSGFHSPARFASSVCRRVLFACVGPRSLFVPRVSRPVRFLRRACFPPPPHLIRRVRLARRLSSPLRLVLSPLVSSRASFRLASPSLAPNVGLLASSISVSCGLVSVLPRSVLRPALLVGWRGDGCGGCGLRCRPVSGGSLLGVPFLCVARSSG